MRPVMRKAATLLMLLLAATACSHKPDKPPYAGIKIGKPYEISGNWYEPAYNAHYDETGIASWYGPGFHGGHTANGEYFDQGDLTAAHRTLPLPCIVRVTNLDNGRSALIKINDRGPFSHDRIIDLSKGAAKKLGVIRTGTAHVRVQFLEKETQEYVANSQGSIHAAMDALSTIDPNEAGERQEQGQVPQLQLQPKMFGAPSSEPAQQTVVTTPEQTTVVTTQEIPALDAAPVETTTTVQSIPSINAPRMAETTNTVIRVPAGSTITASVSEPEPFAAPAVTPAKQPTINGARGPFVHNQPTPTELARDTKAVPDIFTPIDRAEAFMPPVSAPQAATGGYSIQAGTFGREENANKVATQLGGLGDTQVRKLLVNNRAMYRVTLGPFASPEKAKNLLSKLPGMGISGAKVFRNQS